MKFRADLRDRAMDGWSVTQQMIVYKDKLLKRSSNRKSKLVLSTLVTSNICILFATILAANFGCYWFRITLIEVDSESLPDIISKLLRAAILFDSNLSRRPFLRQVMDLGALHRIKLGTCCFVPMSYFYSETNEWSKDWAKRWVLLWSATTSRQFQLFHRIFHFKWKTNPSSLPNLYQAFNLFNSQTKSV